MVFSSSHYPQVSKSVTSWSCKLSSRVYCIVEIGNKSFKLKKPITGELLVVREKGVWQTLQDLTHGLEVTGSLLQGSLCLRGRGSHWGSMLNSGLCRSFGKFTSRSNPHPVCHGHGRRNANLLEYASSRAPKWGQASVGHNSNPPSYPCVNALYYLIPSLSPPFCHWAFRNHLPRKLSESK